MPVVALVMAAVAGYFAWGWLSPERYAAEVIFRHGTESRLEIWGDFAALDECRNAAIGRYNVYFREGRAVSWACLLKDGRGGYVSRHR